MTESAWPVMLLGVMTGCLAMITITIVLTTRDLRQTLRRVETALPLADQTLRDLHRSLRSVRRMLTRADRLTSHVEAVVDHMCDAAQVSLDRFMGWKTYVQTLFKGVFENGAGAEPRSHHRRR